MSRYTGLIFSLVFSEFPLNPYLLADCEHTLKFSRGSYAMFKNEDQIAGYKAMYIAVCRDWAGRCIAISKLLNCCGNLALIV